MDGSQKDLYPRLVFVDTEKVKPFHSLFILIALAFSSLPAEAQVCNGLLRGLYQKMARHDLKPEQLQFEVWFQKGARQFEYRMKIYDGDVPIGDVEINNLKDASRANIQYVTIHHPAYLDRGVGTILYLLAAKDIYVKTGFLVEKSYMTSSLADRMWDRLNRRGLARNDRMLARSLQAEDLNGLYRQYLKRVKPLSEKPEFGWGDGQIFDSPEK